MTAEKLSLRYEIGLEHDLSYDRVLAAFCDLVTRPGVKSSELLDFMRTELPADRPDFFKVLFIETTARMLGQKWVGNTCSFIDVTIGTARLQDVIKFLSLEFSNHRSRANVPFAGLLTPHGEQHTLAPRILGLLFDSMGWDNQIVEGRDCRGPALHRVVERSDVICIAWSNVRLMSEFRELVDKIREWRKGTEPAIVVGGAAALDSVDFLVGMGIDCICDSVYAASKICESFHEMEKISLTARSTRLSALVNPYGIDWLTP